MNIRQGRIRRLGALAVTLGAALLGSVLVAAPAHAATITNISVTSTGPLTAGEPNAEAIVVTFTAPTEMTASTANSSWVGLMDADWVTAPVNYSCGSLLTVSNDQSLAIDCSAGDMGVYGQSMSLGGSVVYPANTTWTFTFAPNTVVLPYAATMSVGAMTMVAVQDGQRYDEGWATIELDGFVADDHTVTFDANGGEGTMAAQIAGTDTALSSNAFTRAGYSFAGWNTAADGTGTAYDEGASYAFTADVTLYAQWTPALASTGVNARDVDRLMGAGAVIAAAGVSMLLMRRRHSAAQ